MKKYMSNFGFDSLTCDHALFPAKNNPNGAKRNRIFAGIVKGGRVFITTYLDSSLAKAFPLYYLLF